MKYTKEHAKLKRDLIYRLLDIDVDKKLISRWFRINATTLNGSYIRHWKLDKGVGGCYAPDSEQAKDKA